MQTTENQNGISNHQAIRESTHVINRCGRNGIQQYFDNGFGKIRNADFEPLHYSDH